MPRIILYFKKCIHLLPHQILYYVRKLVVFIIQFLEDSKDIANLHVSLETQGQSESVNIADVDTHFITFVSIKNLLFELVRLTLFRMDNKMVQFAMAL